MDVINGNKVADKIISSVKIYIKKNRLKPSLAVILVGKDTASRLYVSIKQRRSKQVGIKFKKFLFSNQTTEKQIISLIQKLNQDKKISGILVQLPLPKHLNSDKIIDEIDIQKDVDGIHPKNLEKIKKNIVTTVLPATTGAVGELLQSAGVKLANKSVAIIGKSKIAGLPTYFYLKDKVKKINIYDHKTINLAEKTKQADILVVAIGQPEFITQEYIKKGAIIIDIGINKKNNKTVGDVDFKKVNNKAGLITPVPGGVGPVTVAVLLKNTAKLARILDK